MPLRRRRPSSEDEDEADDDAIAALRRAEAVRRARRRKRGMCAETLVTGESKTLDDDDAREGRVGTSRTETRMLGTTGAFARGGTVLAGREVVGDGAAAGRDGGADARGTGATEEARVTAYVEEELRRRRGEMDGANENVAGGGGGVTDDGADGDHRGAKCWLTAIEEVDVSVERRMQNIEETERAKRAMLDGARPGEVGAFEVLKPSHVDVREAKKRPPPSENALARARFVGGFGAKHDRQRATEENKRDKERRKNFFKKKRKR